MRNTFNQEMNQLKRMLIDLGEINVSGIEKALDVFLKRDEKILQEVIELEKTSDDKTEEIEKLCMSLILKQQPVASDLRMIMAALNMIVDMERISDQTKDIGKLAIKMSFAEYEGALVELPKMAKICASMVEDGIQSFIYSDLEKANEVCDRDDKVDLLFNTVKKKISAAFHSDVSDEEGGEDALNFLMIAKYWERIGDHAGNIAEWVIYSITGEHKLYGKDVH